MRLGKETSKGSSQGSPAAVVDRLGLVAGLDQVLFTSYIPALCVFIFVRLFSFSFSFFFFLFITHSPTVHTQLLVFNETPEPRSVEFFSCCFWELFFFF